MDYLNQAPGVFTRVEELSNLPKVAGLYVVGVQGITLRGEVAKPQYVATSERFREYFGGQHPEDTFPLLCMRLLDAGVPLQVSRVGHYGDITDGDTLSGTKASGTSTVDANELTVQAKSVGAGYNGTLTVASAASGKAAHYDISFVTADGFTDLVTDVPESLTAQQLIDYSDKFRYLNLVSLTGTLVAGSVAVSGGEQDVDEIVAQDFIGSATTATGWESFAGIEDIFRLANISKPVPEVDVALAQYARKRMKAGNPIRFHAHPPVAALTDAMIDYREGTGVYTQSPIDDWLGSMIGGGLNINNPENIEQRLSIPALVDVLIRETLKDNNEGPWRSAAGYELGKISTPQNGVVYNVGVSDRQDEFNRLTRSGVNMLIEERGSVVYWGNRTLLRDSSKLLSKDNVANLVVYLIRTIRPYLKEVNFQPNDPTTWKDLYRKVRPVFEDLVARRAIEPGEGSGWAWIGDQEAESINDVSFNKPTDILQGIYKTRALVVPIGAVEYADLTLSITDPATMQVLINN